MSDRNLLLQSATSTCFIYVDVECTTINEDCDCTEERCSDLNNTVCNSETGACECDENYIYSNSTGQCKEVTSEYLVTLSKFFFIIVIIRIEVP